MTDRDCNTCMYHKQGSTLEDSPAICHDCANAERFTGKKLPMWKPIVVERSKDNVFFPEPEKYKVEFFDTPSGFPEEVPLEPPKANDVQVGGSHYKNKPIQPWDYIVANKLGFLDGNVVKYVTRFADKGGVQDLMKARHYLDKLIETQQEKA